MKHFLLHLIVLLLAIALIIASRKLPLDSSYSSCIPYLKDISTPGWHALQQRLVSLHGLNLAFHKPLTYSSTSPVEQGLDQTTAPLVLVLRDFITQNSSNLSTTWSAIWTQGDNWFSFVASLTRKDQIFQS